MLECKVQAFKVQRTLSITGEPEKACFFLLAQVTCNGLSCSHYGSRDDVVPEVSGPRQWQ